MFVSYIKVIVFETQEYLDIPTVVDSHTFVFEISSEDKGADIWMVAEKQAWDICVELELLGPNFVQSDRCRATQSCDTFVNLEI